MRILENCIFKLFFKKKKIKEAYLNLDGVVSFSEFVALFKKHQQKE